MTRRRVLRALAAVVFVAVVLGVWRGARVLLRPSPPPPDDVTRAQAARVRIFRDAWGVPHVFGKTDADAAFGLAYAHAEDDFPTIQGVLAASRGRLSWLVLSKQAIANDYYAVLADVQGEVDRAWPTVGADFREVIEAYARGLNYYAWRHPKECDARLLPFTGRDVLAGFAHKIPLMVGLPAALSAVTEGAPKAVGALVVAAGDANGAEARANMFPGSNAHAVAASRATDGITRLNVNSHQPWEGPVAWYEVQIASEEGWNVTGGLFPGSPVAFLGHNDHLGWGHTVNEPDLVDVYALVTDAAHDGQYFFDGAWRAFEEKKARIEIDTGWFVLPISKAVYRSVHGPVMSNGDARYAFRWAGVGRAARAAEQWYRMNKARTLDEWKAAMRLQALPMFNTVYADATNIGYVYNALIPVRRGAYDYKRVLPGDAKDALWDDYVPWDALPHVDNPKSGFVLTCNATPFRATAGEDNPRSEDFPENTGIERDVNNRTLRSLSLFGAPGPISRDDFARFKWDRTYDPEGPLAKTVAEVIARAAPATDGERRGLELLRAWDRVADDRSRAAALAILTYDVAEGDMAATSGAKSASPVDAFKDGVAFLEKSFGRVDPELGEVQRLRRGAVDLPIGGGPDVLNAVHARRDGGALVGKQGDSLVILAEFGPAGATSRSINVYGASNRPGSPHYADQAPLFVRHELKPPLRTLAEIRAHLDREYTPAD